MLWFFFRGFDNFNSCGWEVNNLSRVFDRFEEYKLELRVYWEVGFLEDIGGFSCVFSNISISEIE